MTSGYTINSCFTLFGQNLTDSFFLQFLQRCCETSAAVGLPVFPCHCIINQSTGGLNFHQDRVSHIIDLLVSSFLPCFCQCPRACIFLLSFLLMSLHVPESVVTLGLLRCCCIVLPARIDCNVFVVSFCSDYCVKAKCRRMSMLGV